MIKYVSMVLASMAILACTHTEKQTGNVANMSHTASLPLTDSAAADSMQIVRLVPENHTYRKHVLTDLDNDTVPELLLVSRSLERSACKSFMYDSVCFYSVLGVYRKDGLNWELQGMYKIEDADNTYIDTDSLSNLRVKQYYKPSGYSLQEITGTYRFTKDEFYLKKIFLTVNTNFGYGTHNSWEYILDLETQKMNIHQTISKLVENKEGDSEYELKDSARQRSLAKKYTIKLGEVYDIDTLIGEENILFSY